MPSYCWVALLLSVAMHVALYFSVGKVQGGKGNTGTTSVVQVHLAVAPPAHGAQIGDQEPAASKPPAPTSLAEGRQDAKLAPAKELTNVPASTALPDADSEQAALLPLIAPQEAYYFHGKELTEKPRPQQEIPSQITFSDASQLPESLVLRLLIDEAGSVDKVEIEDIQVPDSVAKVIAEHFDKIKFYPGKIQDLPVKSRLRIEIQLDAVSMPIQNIDVSHF